MDLGEILIGAGAIITALATWRGMSRKVTSHIGTPNGKGNVVQMSEQMLEQNRQILLAIGRVEGELKAHMQDRNVHLR
ncbi:MAG TPA: hypothetical protein VJQ57_09340 [Acidimicrobiia bacterium]|nr:hypothetical protein [Acidimicrobiia bacterium]